MENTRPILYGVADYAEIRRANAWFIDRTAKIRDLEGTRYAVFLRPRRFGKSLLISMLHAYYDVNFADRFEEFFGGTDIGANPTDERGRYLVLYFDFSAVSNEVAEVQRKFNTYASLCCDTFARNYRTRLPEGLADRIVAVGEGKYVADSALYARVQRGEVAEVGNGPTLSLEKLMTVQPDLVMDFATGGGQDDYERINSLGFPLMLTSEWQEEHPLAKVEWIKLFGALFGKESLADSIYEQSKQSYLKAVGEGNASSRPCPRVIAGMNYGGVWYAPGGNSFTARLIKDAGGCYLWASDTSRELTFTLEEIMLVADSADVWVNPGAFSSPEDLLAAEPRIKHIRAFREKRVCQNDGRKGPGGGNDFYESAVAYPAELLLNLRDCIQNATNGTDSVRKEFDWYRNIFIF